MTGRRLGRRHGRRTAAASAALCAFLGGAPPAAAVSDDAQNCMSGASQRASAACSRALRDGDLNAWDRAALLARRAGLHAAAGRHAAAAADFDAALAAAPNRQALLFGRARARLAAGDAAGAAADFSRVLRLSPGNAAAAVGLAAARGALGAYDEAVAALDAAARLGAPPARLAPLRAQALLGRALRLVDAGDANGAMADVAAARAIAPDTALAFHALGSVFAALRRSDEALAAFETTLSLGGAPWRAAYRGSLAEQGYLGLATALLRPGEDAPDPGGDDVGDGPAAGASGDRALLTGLALCVADGCRLNRP